MGDSERDPADPQENRLAVRTEDHPMQYLDFHGEIPKGEYGAGTMKIWDSGTYETHKFDADKVEVTFHGERLRGRYGLFPIGKRASGGGSENDWMIHRMDPPASVATTISASRCPSGSCRCSPTGPAAAGRVPLRY